jgi:TRAP-type C4-dicarboxylate transport system permease small subunit
MDRLLRWLQKPIDLLLWLGLAAGFLMMVHVTIDVTSRYLLNRPLEGTTEIVAAYYMVVVAYAPWAWIASRDGHIVAGMFQHIGTPRFDFWLEILVKICTAVCVAVFTYQTYLAALRQTRAGEVWLAGTMYVPVWPSRWVLPVSGAVMVVYLALRVISDVAGATRR